jgi:DNA-binding NarL/FixJ family response regulator
VTGVIDVAAVDDHPIILESVARWVVSDEGDIRVVATALTVDELLAGPGRHARVVLLDLSLGDGTTVERNVAAILAAGPAVLVLSASERPLAVRAAIHAGARGYALKSELATGIHAAIREVAAGGDWISPRLAYILATDDAIDKPTLSNQEARILQLYATGLPMKSVARRMAISEETVKRYLGHVREKYARAGRTAPTKVELHHRAVEEGHVPAYASSHDDWTGSGDGPADTRVPPPGSYSQPGGGSGGYGHMQQGDYEVPPRRFLTGIAPERAPAGARISLLVQVTLAEASRASASLKDLPVSPAGTVVTITVSAPGLVPLGDLEQDLTVPLTADSDPVRFGFRADRIGLHSVQVRAFAGGTCLGELALEISVETGATLEEGRLQAAPLPDLAAEPGEVTLQVSRTGGGGYSFQLLSGTFYPAVIIDRLARDPSEVIGQMIAELRAMSKSTAQYAAPELARRRLRSLGSQLWGDVVPRSIREQFWAQRDRIRLFTIASNMDTVPWELLYPVDLDNDDGFLVEQFPVVRRVYGQDRARVLRLDSGVGFIVPPKSPANVRDEVGAVRAAFPKNVGDRGIKAALADVLELLDSVPSVLHFAGHNAFTDETGSLISLDGGPLRPSDLSYARQRRAFEATRPLVFLNGCRTAGEIPGFTQMTGWASEFMGAGAGAFIGSLWPVRSAAAQAFAAKFYHALARDKKTLGVASLQARQAIAADEGDPTWLAYTIYGNPSASIDHMDRRLMDRRL